jgi:hypothetical protein
MDRTTISDHLAQAERHVVTGERTLARQRAIVAGLQQDGHDTAQARSLLARFQETQALHIADRDRLHRELAALP